MDLIDALPGRITQLMFRTGLRKRQVRGAVLTLIRQGRARYFRGRVIPITQETTMQNRECDRCGDSRLVTLFDVDNGIGGTMDADEQPCPECEPKITIVPPPAEHVKAARIRNAVESSHPAYNLLGLVDDGQIEHDEAVDAYWATWQSKLHRPLVDVAADELVWGNQATRKV